MQLIRTMCLYFQYTEEEHHHVVPREDKNARKIGDVLKSLGLQTKEMPCLNTSADIYMEENCRGGILLISAWKKSRFLRIGTGYWSKTSVETK